MKIAVIVTNAGQAANTDGGRCERFVVLAEAGEELAARIMDFRKDPYNTIELAVVTE